MPIQSINPATGEVFASFGEFSDEKIESTLASSYSGFLRWRSVKFSERSFLMKNLATLIRKRSDELAKLATREMGKPILQSRAENQKSAMVCEYYADMAEKFLTTENVIADYMESYIEFEPIGPILAVMPWNFPLWQVFRFAAPAIMAGNVVLLKHASNVPQCALAIEKIFMDAGFSDGVFKSLLIGSDKVEKIIKDDRVFAVTLTGSEKAGRSVASIAGGEIKKIVMELGGSDPFIILDDADMELVCEHGPMARLQNNGQSCIASKRFIVDQRRADEFVLRFKNCFESMIIGDPMNELTQIGPMVNGSALSELDSQVSDSILAGAHLVTGGRRVGEVGYFYAPTILTEVKKGMRAYEEELFGPVASVIVAKDEDDAIRIANDTRFGLGASIWTRDTDRGKRLASQIHSGAVFINGIVKSDPRLPFGGVKNSGIGRELSHYGIKEFVNIKSIVVMR